MCSLPIENDGRGVDHDDKRKRSCLLRPLLGPTELPTSGYVPKTNDLSGRWLTVGGGDTEFIKKSFARGMLGGAGASKVQAARFHVFFFFRESPRMNSVQSQCFGCFFDRAVRTLKFGHYLRVELESIVSLARLCFILTCNLKFESGLFVSLAKWCFSLDSFITNESRRSV